MIESSWLEEDSDPYVLIPTPLFSSQPELFLLGSSGWFGAEGGWEVGGVGVEKGAERQPCPLQLQRGPLRHLGDEAP